ncbi:GDSL-type esterase/lipase family protein [Mucilaginibacter myungsuensis]|uniref:GDSL family lipase n=1 Tax=Mucilaginibacter myungsuensis TaxID=649104 RepID=A0A929PZ76_9SPHI|nr:GDSL-type esterase/lipase family protein [Mucilaginibacter myungsuensis]MBE9664220.1 GDSL family lipase [Mucilaginibacter myungsuensis]MDN3599922.1 GDSL-type esterase/lipase family protein [Mucilaginibacter myungsuensis]
MFWYEDEIKGLEEKRAELTYKPETLFYGSSSVRLWTSLNDDFAGLVPVNLGFGGSTLAACAWFFDRVMAGYQPKRLIIYAGDNDLSDGRHPEELFLFFQQLTVRVKKRFGNIPCYFISLKPSPSRWHIIEQFKYTNRIIAAEIDQYHPNWHFINIFELMLDRSGQPEASFYAEDKLHLSPKGYALWANAVRKAVND